jgi:hypothetical protein
MNIRKIALRSLAALTLAGFTATAAVPTLETTKPIAHASVDPGPPPGSPGFVRCAWYGGDWVRTPYPHCVYP